MVGNIHLSQHHQHQRLAEIIGARMKRMSLDVQIERLSRMEYAPPSVLRIRTDLHHLVDESSQHTARLAQSDEWCIAARQERGVKVRFPQASARRECYGA